MNNNATSISLPKELSDYFSLSEAKYITLTDGENAFQVVKNHLGKSESTKHFGYSREKKTSRLSGHLGLHETSHEEKKLFVLVQTHGDPVGTSCGTAVYETMTVFDPAGDAKFIQSFLDYLIDESEKNAEGEVNVYSWHMRYGYWQSLATRPKRSLDTIILPEATKKHIFDDIDRFLAPEAAEWYSRHCIPYKRNILFTGPPGTGKSSFITALSSHFDRNICFLQPCHKDMTDDMFKRALGRLPLKSVLVLEDIDALFGTSRMGLHSQCPMTFSGFLNGLDGLGSPSGQLIMMTTNHVERLDPALLRAGRVDCRAELSLACKEQLISMFLSFYPGKAKEANKFAMCLSEKYPDGLSLAAVQNHFIYHRVSDAETASALGPDDLLRLKCNQPRGDEEDEEEKEEEAEDAEEKKEKKEQNDEDAILKCIDYFEKIMKFSTPAEDEAQEVKHNEQKEATEDKPVKTSKFNTARRLGLIENNGTQIFTMFVGFCLASKLLS